MMAVPFAHSSERVPGYQTGTDAGTCPLPGAGCSRQRMLQLLSRLPRCAEGTRGPAPSSEPVQRPGRLGAFTSAPGPCLLQDCPRMAQLAGPEVKVPRGIAAACRTSSCGEPAWPPPT